MTVFRPTETLVAVAGGGITGAATALALAAANDQLQILLIEPTLPAADLAAPQDPPDLRVSALNLQSERFLSAIGAWHHLNADRLHAYRALRVSDGDQVGGQTQTSFGSTQFSVADLGRRSPGHLGNIVENNELQRAIWAQLRTLPNVSLLQGKVVSLRDEPDGGCTLDLDEGSKRSTVFCRVLVGADGAASPVRRMAGIVQASEGYFQKALVIGVELDDDAGDVTWQAFRPSGPLAYLPLFARSCPVTDQPIPCASLVWYDSPATIAELLSLELDTLEQRVRATFPALLPRLRRVYARAAFPLAKSHCRHYSRNAVVLVGDAAHTINPLAGQGLNLGIQDAEALAAALAPVLDGQSAPATADIQKAFAAYERSRRSQNLLMTAAVDLFYHAFSNDIGPLRLLRRIGLAAADRSGPLKRRVLKHALGIDQATEVTASQAQQTHTEFSKDPKHDRDYIRQDHQA